jgi:cephalosporin hydroxylase
MNKSDEYHRWYEENRVWETTTWMGVPAWKLPNDAWVIQELVWRVRPGIVVETGTGCGGSALFYASLLKLLDVLPRSGGHNSYVITIDRENRFEKYLANASDEVRNLWETRVAFIEGDSIKVFPDVRECADGFPIMVLLDSWHSKDHVLREMELYSELVTPGSYLIVEDTHVSGHPVPWEWGEGPFEAVEEFLSRHGEFEIDRSCERLGMTFNPGGFLRRVSKTEKRA